MKPRQTVLRAFCMLLSRLIQHFMPLAGVGMLDLHRVDVHRSTREHGDFLLIIVIPLSMSSVWIFAQALPLSPHDHRDLEGVSIPSQGAALRELMSSSFI